MEIEEGEGAAGAPKREEDEETPHAEVEAAAVDDAPKAGPERTMTESGEAGSPRGETAPKRETEKAEAGRGTGKRQSGGRSAAVMAAYFEEKLEHERNLC